VGGLQGKIVCAEQKIAQVLLELLEREAQSEDLSEGFPWQITRESL
jgi:hypothetical protein